MWYLDLIQLLVETVDSSSSLRSFVPRTSLPPCWMLASFNSLTVEAQVLRDGDLGNALLGMTTIAFEKHTLHGVVQVIFIPGVTPCDTFKVEKKTLVQPTSRLFSNLVWITKWPSVLSNAKSQLRQFFFKTACLLFLGCGLCTGCTSTCDSVGT